MLYGIMLIVMGIALQALSYAFGGGELERLYFWLTNGIVNYRNANWNLYCWKVIGRKIDLDLARI